MLMENTCKTEAETNRQGSSKANIIYSGCQNYSSWVICTAFREWGVAGAMLDLYILDIKFMERE